MKLIEYNVYLVSIVDTDISSHIAEYSSMCFQMFTG